MKKLGLIAIILLFANMAFAAEGKDVTYKSGDEMVHGILYTPANAKAKMPAIVVIHEWWGLNDWVKQQAAKFADEGYITLAIDLYRGKVATSADEAHELMRGLPEDRAVRDLKAAMDFLQKQKNVDPARIGSIGWCMGGGYSLAMALVEPRLRATVINYGRLVTDDKALQGINAAILGIFGAQDRGIPVESVKKFEAQLKKLNKRVEIKIYDDAGHAFENPNNKDGYKPQDAAEAWRLQTQFFASWLKK